MLIYKNILETFSNVHSSVVFIVNQINQIKLLQIKSIKNVKSIHNPIKGQVVGY